MRLWVRWQEFDGTHAQQKSWWRGEAQGQGGWLEDAEIVGYILKKWSNERNVMELMVMKDGHPGD